MNNRVINKTAMVTAAAAGIGRASCLALLREGATVWASDINESGLAQLDADARSAGLGGRLHTAVLDVRNTEAVRALAAQTGRVDILFNCAGYVHAGSVLQATEADWDFGMDLNVKSMLRMIQAFLPPMVGHGGSIINMASAASSIKAVPNRCVYSATKAAVIGLTKSVAADFVQQAIRCNAICPGTVESPSLQQRIATQASATGDTIEAVQAGFVARQPMGRLGTPEEIAQLVVYLASDESAFTTGAVHVIDGGWSA